MILKSVRGRNFKCIEDSGPLNVDRIARLVGQNESGKTALLELLRLLNPIEGEGIFILEDYPRKKLSQYKRTHPTAPESPVTAVFELTDAEMKAIEAVVGPGTVTSKTITATKRYEDKTRYLTVHTNERKFIAFLLKECGLDAETAKELKKADTIADLLAKIEEIETESDGLKALQKRLGEVPEGRLTKLVIQQIDTPKFFYFDEYATLPGKISLKELKTASAAKEPPKDAGLRTALALIRLAGISIDEIQNPENHERLMADLEAASNEITDQLRRYWTSNKHLEIQFKLEPQTDAQNRLVDTILHVRVWNTRHRVTVPFEKRSKGFVWFFSFLVAFSEYRNHKGDLILLLDEPALNLGAKAQHDFLRYIRNELLPHHQVLYSTHSPFMIDPQDLESVRTVEDEEERGTVVSNDPFKHNRDTLFPLQAALGYELTQTLFIAPNNLLVEGPADLIYLQLASELLRSSGGEQLDPAWTLVPVGGADKVSTFVSLLGANRLQVAVFMDASETEKDRINSILKTKLLLRGRMVTVGGVLGVKEADVEDLFAPSSYLSLVNHSYKAELNGKTLTENDLPKKSSRIVKRIEEYFQQHNINDGKFSHYKPAYDLMLNPQLQKTVFDTETTKRFQRAISVVNAALDSKADPRALPIEFLAQAQAATAAAPASLQ